MCVGGRTAYTHLATSQKGLARLQVLEAWGSWNQSLRSQGRTVMQVWQHCWVDDVNNAVKRHTHHPPAHERGGPPFPPCAGRAPSPSSATRKLRAQPSGQTGALSVPLEVCKNRGSGGVKVN